MAFSFNWAGVNVPQAMKGDKLQQSIADAGNWGAAARGLVNRSLDSEYADMIRGRREMQAGIDGIKAEIDRLEARQAEIRAIIGGA